MDSFDDNDDDDDADKNNDSGDEDGCGDDFVVTVSCVTRHLS